MGPPGRPGQKGEIGFPGHKGYLILYLAGRVLQYKTLHHKTPLSSATRHSNSALWNTGEPGLQGIIGRSGLAGPEGQRWEKGEKGRDRHSLLMYALATLNLSMKES